MAEIMDFPPAREDAKVIATTFEDGKAVNWFVFSVKYHDMDEDKAYTFQIVARDFEDAQRRLRFIRETSEVEGRLHEQIPL